MNPIALHEAIGLISGMCQLQINKQRVSIPYLGGPPGGGKTESLHSMANKRYWGIESTHLANELIEELTGIPSFYKLNEDEMKKYFSKLIEQVLVTKWSLPEIVYNLYKKVAIVKELQTAALKEGKIKSFNPVVVWILDDIHLADEEKLNLLFKLLIEKFLKSHKIPDEVAIVLAGNYGSNKAGAKTNNSAIVNRENIMLVYTDYDAWKKDFAIPNGLNQTIISFLGNSLYRKFFHEEEQLETPWASPRQWTNLSTLINAYEKHKQGCVEPRLIEYLTAGHVGDESAAYFTEYYSIFKHHDVEKILSTSKNFRLPSSDIDQYTLIYAIIAYMNEQKYDIKDIGHVIEIYLQERKELGMMFLKECSDVISVIDSNIIREAIDSIKNS